MTASARRASTSPTMRIFCIIFRVEFQNTPFLVSPTPGTPRPGTCSPPRPDSELLSFCSPPAAPQRGSLFLFIGFDSLNSTVNPTGHIIFWSTIVAYSRAFDMGLTHSRIVTCYIVHLKLISLGLLFQFSYAVPVLPPGMIVFQRGFTRPLLHRAGLSM